MPKTVAERFRETIDFIRNWNPANVGMRNRAADFADVYVAGLGGQTKTVGESLSIDDHSADPLQDRPARRAFLLLHKAISRVEPLAIPAGTPAAAITIAGATARLHLPALIRMAAIIRDQHTGSQYCMNMVLNELHNAPLAFLQNNKVMVFGSMAWDHTQGDRNAQVFRLSCNLTMGPRYEFHGEIMYPGAAGVTVDSVVARSWTDIPGSHVKGGDTALGNFSQLTGIELASRFMVTTQFTGCAFAMKRHAGRLYCAHTAPKRPQGFTDVVRDMDGFKLANEVRLVNGVRGDFANANGGAHLAIYGSGYSDGVIGNVHYPMHMLGAMGDYMTVVGVARGTDHEIYSQITQVHAITSAQQIF